MEKGKEKIRELAKIMGHDEDKFIEALDREGDDKNYTDEEKRMLADVSLLKLMLEVDITTAVIFMDILNALTGLEMKEAQDVVQYVSKSISDIEEYGQLVANCTMKFKASNSIEHLMNELSGLMGQMK